MNRFHSVTGSRLFTVGIVALSLVPDAGLLLPGVSLRTRGQKDYLIDELTRQSQTY